MKSFFLFIVFIYSFSSAQTSPHDLISKMNASLKTLVEIQTRVKDIYPCLQKFHPVAVPYKDSLLIFDYDSSWSGYKMVRETPQPFPLPEGIQASFPLSVYGNKATCIVNLKTFNDTAGYATILHEFIHCCQYSGAEPELKSKLVIYKDAMKNKDYMWEISHPFPYDDSVFVSLYDRYKKALGSENLTKAKELRQMVKQHLNPIDFEYMVWEEWKEGLARFVENKIHDKLNIPRNNYGKDEPYNRVSFYYSGELLITRLSDYDPGLPADMKSLFEKMREF